MAMTSPIPRQKTRVTDRKPKRRGLRDDLITILVRHVGEVQYVDDLAQQTKVTEAQVKSALWAGVKARPDLDIEVTVPGRAWTYRGKKTATSSRRCFEEVGTTKDGSLIIQSDDGKLYRAVELQF